MAMKVTYRFGGYAIQAETGSLLALLCSQLRVEFPDLVMRRKRDVWYQYIAHVFIVIFTLGFNRRYFEYTTTGPNVIDISDTAHARICAGSHSDRIWELLMHERVHLRQFRDRGKAVMVLDWLFPPTIRCYGRAKRIELPAYLVSLQCKFRTDREWAESKEYREWWIGQFTGPGYGWSWTKRSDVEKWFDDELKQLQGD